MSLPAAKDNKTKQRMPRTSEDGGFFVTAFLRLFYKAFRHVETLFVQVSVFIRTGRINTLPWIHKVSTCRKALLFLF